MESHIETIKCPHCEDIQSAEVRHTEPWWLYVHNCNRCGYTIMESEWEEVYVKVPLLQRIKRVSVQLWCMITLYIAYIVYSLIMMYHMLKWEEHEPHPIGLYVVVSVWCAILTICGRFLYVVFKQQTTDEQ